METRSSKSRLLENQKLTLKGSRAPSELTRKQRVTTPSPVMQFELPSLNYSRLAAVVIGSLAVALLVMLMRLDKQVEPLSPDLSSLQTGAIRLPELRAEKRVSFVHEVSRGETLGKIFSSYGLSPLDASRLQQSMKDLGELESIRSSLLPRQRLEFELDEEGNLVGVSSKLAKNLDVFFTKEEENFSGTLTRITGVTKERVVSGEISREHNSFASAANKSGLSYAVIDDFVDLFSNRVGFRRDLRLGDEFVVIYEDERLPDGTILRVGPIRAAAMVVRGSRYAAIRYKADNGKTYYFDEDGNSLDNVFLRYPLKFSRISSVYTHKRFHPVLKRYRPHLGVDFAAPTGTPVRSVAHGRVTFAGRKGPNGILIKIKHSDKYETAYLHLSKIERGVRRGALVKRGQVIGRVGSTGLSTGPHLDFRLKKNGKYVDPVNAKLPTISELDPKVKLSEELKRDTIEELDRVLSKPVA